MKKLMMVSLLVVPMFASADSSSQGSQDSSQQVVTQQVPSQVPAQFSQSTQQSSQSSQQQQASGPKCYLKGEPGVKETTLQAIIDTAYANMINGIAEIQNQFDMAWASVPQADDSSSTLNSLVAWRNEQMKLVVAGYYEEMALQCVGGDQSQGQGQQGQQQGRVAICALVCE